MPTSRISSKLLTKADLATGLRHLHDAIRSEMKENTRELVRHFNRGQAVQNKRLDHVDRHLVEANTKLEAIMSGEVLVTKDQLLNLIRELRTKGIELDESRIFSR